MFWWIISCSCYYAQVLTFLEASLVQNEYVEHIILEPVCVHLVTTLYQSLFVHLRVSIFVFVLEYQLPFELVILLS